MTDDTISRATALKGLEDLNVASFYELNEHSKEAYTEIKAMLKSQPSAQPEYTEQDMREQFNAGYACGMHAAQPGVDSDIGETAETKRI